MIHCTCGKEVAIRTDKRIAKHVRRERLVRGLLVLERCPLSERKIRATQVFVSGGSSVIWWGVAP